ncbi:MAG TPA: hypothetical protein VFS76_21345 [Pyrinomonadaceae bacterium]|nr:hypothetical protein [Pyrinomonadaceae bacterium]
MSRLLITSLIASLLVLPQDVFSLTEYYYDLVRNETKVVLPREQFSGPKKQYHSLSYSIFYSHPGKPGTNKTLPKDVNFELVSVVKARELNSDLYVVFLVDGKEIHFSSNRASVPKPVRGKPWIGERMVFLVPYEEFSKMVEAKTLGVKLGGVVFEFGEDTRHDIKQFAKTITDPVSFPSTPPQTFPRPF